MWLSHPACNEHALLLCNSSKRDLYTYLLYTYTMLCSWRILQGLSFITFLNILELSAVEDDSDVIETHCYQ